MFGFDKHLAPDIGHIGLKDKTGKDVSTKKLKYTVYWSDHVYSECYRMLQTQVPLT